MNAQRLPVLFRLYLGALLAALGVILVQALRQDPALDQQVAAWFFMVGLLALVELTDLNFHQEGGRWGLSSSEAILLPLIVGFSFSQVVLGVILGMGVIRIMRWKMGLTKVVFNVASDAVAAAAAAGAWIWLSDSGGTFSPQNAFAAVVAVLLFAVLTHVFVAAAIATSEGRKFPYLLSDVAPAALWNLVGNITIGLFLAAAYSAAEWTLVLAPLPLAALYFGYRAVVKQSLERERVEHLHAASRALAASASFEHALVDFMKATKQIVSAAEARAVLYMNRQWMTCSVRGALVSEVPQSLTGGPMFDLMEEFRTNPQPLVVADGSDAHGDVLVAMGARSFVGIPLMNGAEYAGCLLAIDRLGAEEFGQNDAKLLEALGNELVLTLDSYRLFAQVAEERERFQQIFAGSKEGICLLDEEGVIRAWNPALARITGFEEEDIIGDEWSERVLVRDRNHRRIEGMDIITVPPDEELELVTRQGPPRWVAIMSGEVPTEDTKSWVLLVRDITAEHELEESKSDFLSTISHELRTPLTTIKGSLQVLSRPNASASSDIGKQMVEIMKRGSDRLERLVMNLLAVSQMESGDVQVYPDEVPLEELVRSRIPSILPDHPQVEVEVEEEIAVRADRERLAQAIEHLLDNARKFGPESGLIRIEIEKENGFARVSVSDEGPGIPKIDQDRIFDRFVRLGHVLTRETQGPGVGLFIVKKSIEAMGGSVEVESDAGRGTTFHLRIPLAHPMAAIDNVS